MSVICLAGVSWWLICKFLSWCEGEYFNWLLLLKTILMLWWSHSSADTHDDEPCLSLLSDASNCDMKIPRDLHKCLTSYYFSLPTAIVSCKIPRWVGQNYDKLWFLTQWWFHSSTDWQWRILLSFAPIWSVLLTTLFVQRALKKKQKKKHH